MAAIGGGILLLILLYVPMVPAGFWVAPPTGSMQPAIQGCDVLLYGPGTPEEGDIMMYWRDTHSLIMHRVIDETDDGYVFKGDNLDRTDGVIQRDQIQAEIYAIISTPVPRGVCTAVFRPLYNGYYMLLGADIRFQNSAVTPPA